MNKRNNFSNKDRWQVLWMALLLDALLPEPPNSLHPVAWMGTGIGHLRQWIATWPGYAQSNAVQFVGGVFVILSGLLTVEAGRRLGKRFAKLSFARRLMRFGWLAEALALHLLLSLRGLTGAAATVERALAADDLPEARRLLSWHLVSRETSQLTAGEVAAAAIESVAENASDSVVAPLIWYGVAGLPGALFYRYINTADAMLGYRDPEREWLGKAPARTDDLLNWIPARLTALLLVAAAWIRSADAHQTNASSAWHTWRRDHAVTDSPNAGHPMSAMAGALGVRLTKRGHYTLGGEHREPEGADIGRANRLVRWACVLAVLVITLFVRLRFAFPSWRRQ